MSVLCGKRLHQRHLTDICAVHHLHACQPNQPHSVRAHSATVYAFPDPGTALPLALAVRKLLANAVANADATAINGGIAQADANAVAQGNGAARANSAANAIGLGAIATSNAQATALQNGVAQANSAANAASQGGTATATAAATALATGGC